MALMARQLMSVSIAIALSAAGPGLAGAQDSDTARASLASLVAEALERNPELQVLGRRIEARRARVPQAGALPDPMAMYGVMNEGSAVPFQTFGEAGFSEVYVGLSQDIPFPGKRGLRGQVAAQEVTLEELALEAARRRVGAQVAEAFYDLYAVEAAASILDQQRQVLQQLAGSATTRFSVGSATQHDVFNAQLEQSQILERSSMLEERRLTQGALLAVLTYRPQAPSVEIGAALTPTPLPPLEDLLARAAGSSPAVRQKDAAVQHAERRLALARRERLPDLGVNFTYHNRGALDPYWSYGGTVTLPIWAGRKQKKAIEEVALDLEAARRDVDAARSQVRYEVMSAYRMAEAAGRLLQLYQEGILKQARLALDSAGAQYQVGKVDFLTMITSWRRVLDAETSYHEQLAAHEKAVARIAAHVDGLASHQP